VKTNGVNVIAPFYWYN